MKVHELKIWPDYYADVLSGAKRFEVRLNDRGFEVGDRLRLQEWNPETEEYTGEEFRVRVTYLLSHAELLPGHVVMSIVPAERRARRRRLSPGARAAGEFIEGYIPLAERLTEMVLAAPAIHRKAWRRYLTREIHELALTYGEITLDATGEQLLASIILGLDDDDDDDEADAKTPTPSDRVPA